MNDICRNGLKENLVKIIKKHIRISEVLSKPVLTISVSELAELIADEAKKYSDAFIEGCLV